uniref:Uncharacterized protein n=1 Tax=Setaria viridis TaxID=4556 RepID=A0A4U6UYJ4_SETVI|nr:hypothetical protein SEVIR_4G088600v2 [Setaria viridis]
MRGHRRVPPRARVAPVRAFASVPAAPLLWPGPRGGDLGRGRRRAAAAAIGHSAGPGCVPGRRRPQRLQFEVCSDGVRWTRRSGAWAPRCVGVGDQVRAVLVLAYCHGGSAEGSENMMTGRVPGLSRLYSDTMNRS